MDAEKKRRKKAAESAIANLKIEGLDLCEFGKKLMEKVVNGEITTEQMGLEIDKYVKSLSEKNGLEN